MTASTGRSDLEALLGMRSGQFLLESGHHGDLWLELDLLFADPARITPFAADLAELLRPHHVDVVCGPLTGGAFLAQLVAARLGAGLVWSEKRGPTPTDGLYRATYTVPAPQVVLIEGARVAIVDDVINAGSATRSTSSDVVARGGTPVAVGALMVLGTRARDHADSLGVPLEHLRRRESALWAPGACPLCADGAPLDPGGDG